MENTKFLRYIIFSLVIINLITIGSILYLKDGKGRRPLPHERNEAFLSGELGLEGANKRRVDSLELLHHKEKRKLLTENRRLRVELFALLKNRSNDSLQVTGYINQILKNQREIELMTFQHFKTIETVCTPEQKIKLEETINEAIRMAGGHPQKK